MAKTSRRGNESPVAAGPGKSTAAPVQGTHRFMCLTAASVSLLTFIVYLSCLRNEFVLWDDDCYIYKNPHLGSFDWSFLKWAFTDFHCANWHPLTWISHALDYAVWGLNPMGHHLTNIILHAANTAIVVILVAKLLLNSTSKIQNSKFPLVVASVTGLLFGLHPIHVESVAWAAERKDLLCAMFFMLSILAYTGSKFPDRRYFFSLGFFVLALLSKPMAVSLPAVLLIMDWYPLGRISSLKSFLSALVQKIPFIVLSIISSILTVLAQKAGGAMQTFEAIPLSSRLLVAAESLLSYLWKMAVPVNLVPYYPYPGSISLLSIKYILSLALVLAITAACIVMAKKQKLWLAVWGYYVITLLPVLGIIQVGGQSMADRYAYLPSLGPFFIVGLLAARLWIKRAGFCITAAVLVVLSMSLLTYRQIAVWKNSLTLWSYVAQKEPQDAPLAHYNLGIVYRQHNMPDKAIEQYMTAIRLWPGFAKAHNNLGFMYESLNMPGKAEEEFLAAIKLDPGNAEAHSNLGILYQAGNLPDKAMEEFMTAARLDPEKAEEHLNLGLAYYKAGRMEEARHELERVLEIKPDNQQARQLLKEVMARQQG